MSDARVVVAEKATEDLRRVLVRVRCTPLTGPPLADADGGRNLFHRAEAVVAGLDEHSARRRLRFRESLLDAEDGSARDARRGELREPVIGRRGSKDRAEDPDELRRVRAPRGEVTKASVVREIRAADDLGQSPPELLLGAAHDDPAVGRPEVLEGDERRVRGPRGPRRNEAAVQVPRGEEGKQA